MTTFIIIAVIGLLIFLGTRKKKPQPTPTFQTGSTTKTFQSRISQLQFPDRVDAIVWHIKAIDRGLAEGDLSLANLSYAKLIESIRQQNENEKGKYEDSLKAIRDEYEQFRQTYGMEYPQQFLPPSQRQRTSTTSALSASEKKNLRTYLAIDSKAVSDIQTLFRLSGNEDGFNREFWIAEYGESNLLAKVLSVYSFNINLANFELLVDKANRFIKKMRRDTPYWKEFPLYNIADLQENYSLNLQTDLINKLQSLSIGERLYFFDFAFGKYWNGWSGSKTRNIGINENDAMRKFVKLNLFSETTDLESIPDLVGKKEFKEFADQKGFDGLKKSWTIEKMFEVAMTTEEGKNLLRNFLSNKKVWKFNPTYQDDKSAIVAFQDRIKLVADLICMV